MKTIKKQEKIDKMQELTALITQKYDDMEDARRGQLSDIRLIKNAIYSNNVPSVNEWHTKIQLPDIYELAQTLPIHKRLSSVLF